MKKMTLTAAALTLALTSSPLLWADDATTQPSPSASPNANTPSLTPNANPSAAPTAPTSAAPQTPPDNWTKLTGTVQSVDTAAKTVQIKDDTGNLLQVPVDRQVSIKKDGQRVKLSQVQMGDVIILAKRTTSSQPAAPNTN